VGQISHALISTENPSFAGENQVTKIEVLAAPCLGGSHRSPGRDAEQGDIDMMRNFNDDLATPEKFVITLELFR